MEVFRAWATREGVTSWFVDDAIVELTPGGRYELFFHREAPEGQRGSEGCRVLSYVPDEVLSFSWNFPPTIPALRLAGTSTFVVVQFRDAPGGGTFVTLDSLGWGEGPLWDEGYAYFDRAWGNVLAALAERFAPSKGP